MATIGRVRSIVETGSATRESNWRAKAPPRIAGRAWRVVWEAGVRLICTGTSEASTPSFDAGATAPFVGVDMVTGSMSGMVVGPVVAETGI